MWQAVWDPATHGDMYHWRPPPLVLVFLTGDPVHVRYLAEEHLNQRIRVARMKRPNSWSSRENASK